MLHYHITLIAAYNYILFQISVLGGCWAWRDYTFSCSHSENQSSSIVPSPSIGHQPCLHPSAKVGRAWRNACRRILWARSAMAYISFFLLALAMTWSYGHKGGWEMQFSCASQMWRMDFAEQLKFSATMSNSFRFYSVFQIFIEYLSYAK